MKTLPMGWDWRAAKQQGQQPGYTQQQQNRMYTPEHAELVESLKGHIQSQILNCPDVLKYKTAGDPVRFVQENLVNNLLKPYYMAHHLVNEDIIHLVQWLNSLEYNTTVNEDGLREIAHVYEHYVTMDPKLVANIIVTSIM